MKSIFHTLIFIISLAIAYADPVRPSLPVEKCQHIVVGKVVDIQKAHLFDNKIQSIKALTKQANIKRTVGMTIYSGSILIEKVLKGDLKVGSKIPISWVKYIVVKEDGSVLSRKGDSYNDSIENGVKLQFGLTAKGVGDSWLFIVAAHKE